MYRFVLVVEYIGTNYAGSQKQGIIELKVNNEKITSGPKDPNKKTKAPLKTIQGELEKALSTLTKQKIKTIFSGRTDAGVHAKEQYVHFDTDFNCLTKSFINSLNGILSEDISVKRIEKKDKSFHAQKSAKYRWYRYTIINRNQRSAWDKEGLLVRENLNVKRMNETLGHLLGEHDFTSFKKVKTQNPAKICNVYKAFCTKDNDFIYVDLIANRFLYNMVRSIVGTLLMIEKNSLPPVTIKKILESKDRSKTGPTISPKGLTLMKVIYNENMETAHEDLFS